VALWWILPDIHILKSAEDVIKAYDVIEPAIMCIYTNRSGINSYFSAAAVAPLLWIGDICIKQT
jgi:hypothetical protein